jgi:hypothetical protein
MSITISFTPWGEFFARKRQEEISRWLHEVANTAKEVFQSGMGSYPPASDSGAWPNRRTSALHGSVGTEVTADSATVGSNMRYSIFLREGTRRMKRRKMSDNALQEAMGRARLGRWVEWSRS